jgi:predicted lysophospholipase L1 biosynthesis ABC-type transport system permease subunit
LRITLKRTPAKVLLMMMVMMMMLLLMLWIIRPPHIIAIAVGGFQNFASTCLTRIQRVKLWTLRETVHTAANY